MRSQFDDQRNGSQPSIAVRERNGQMFGTQGIKMMRNKVKMKRDDGTGIPGVIIEGVMRNMSVGRFGVFCGLVGGTMAAVFAASWHSPLVLDSPQYGNVLTDLSSVFWPTVRMIGGWVGAHDPVRYWLRVTASVIANALLYAFVGATGMVLVRRFAAR